MDIGEAELQWENNNIKDKISEYKMMQIEDAKNKEIEEWQIENRVINLKGDEIMRF